MHPLLARVPVVILRCAQDGEEPMAPEYEFPALGGVRHYDVTRYDGRICAGMERALRLGWKRQLKHP